VFVVGLFNCPNFTYFFNYNAALNNAMKHYFFFIILYIPMTLFAQDTLYFDRDWKPSTREKHAFYRPLPLRQVGELLYVQDFYKNGNLQMQGYVSATDETIAVGDTYWYDEEGFDNGSRQFFNKSTVKELVYYHPDKTIWKKVSYNSFGTKEKISVYLKGKELCIGEISATSSYTGIFSPKVPAYTYYSPVDEPEEPRPLPSVPAIEIDTVDGQDIGKIPANAYQEIVYWANGHKAIEKNYSSYGLLNDSRFYNDKGQLINELKEGGDAGTSFSYYTKNELAVMIKTKVVVTNGDQTREEKLSYTSAGQLEEKSITVDGELVESTTLHEGRSVAVQKFENGKPYDGDFTDTQGDKETSYHMQQGHKVGSVITRDSKTNAVFAEGTYQNGIPFQGSFYITENDNLYLFQYQNGKQEGIQKMFTDYDGQELGEEYEMKSGQLSGFRRIYDDGVLKFESQYIDGKITKGTVLDGVVEATYQDGKLVERRIRSKYSTERIAIVEKYTDNQLAVIEYRDFTLTEKPNTTYSGFYKNGQPYDGYFKLDTLIDNIPLISYFEKGVMRYMYSFELLDQLESYDHYTYDRRSEYINGKIANGVTYRRVNTDRLITTYYTSGDITGFDVNLFAMHYFNRLTFRKDPQALVISEIISPLQLRVYSKENSVVAEITKEGEVVKISVNGDAPGEGSPNSIIQYYEDGGRVQKFITAIDTSRDEWEENHHDSFVSKLFYLFPVKGYTDVSPVFNQFYANFQQDDLDQAFELNLNSSRPVNEKNYLGYLQYGQEGKPTEGIHIVQQADKSVVVQAIVNKEIKESLKFKSITDLLNNRDALKELEHKILNDY